MLDNVEFTGLDFKQFFVLMSSIDIVYIYGKEENGKLNLEVIQIFIFSKI
jgi:hypothetical protein